MALRFRKSFKILPGVRINIGKTGITGLTLGKRGLSVSTGKQGQFLNVGGMGTGLSLRAKLNQDRESLTPKEVLEAEMEPVSEMAPVPTAESGLAFAAVGAFISIVSIAYQSGFLFLGGFLVIFGVLRAIRSFNSR